MNGWKILAGVVAVITAQNLADLAREFTVTRLHGGGPPTRSVRMGSTSPAAC
jgi:hypothetical protein